MGIRSGCYYGLIMASINFPLDLFFGIATPLIRTPSHLASIVPLWSLWNRSTLVWLEIDPTKADPWRGRSGSRRWLWSHSNNTTLCPTRADHHSERHSHVSRSLWWVLGWGWISWRPRLTPGIGLNRAPPYWGLQYKYLQTGSHLDQFE